MDITDAEGFQATTDSDGDGLPDTAVDATVDDLVLRTDLDADGDPDSEIRISGTGAATLGDPTTGPPPVEEPGTAAAAAGRVLQTDWAERSEAVPPVSVDPDTGRWTGA